MKKYSKPVVKKDVVNDINEAVFLGGSGPGWSRSDCYFSAFNPTQTFAESDGTIKMIFQCDITHNCDAAGVDVHWVWAQYTIFTFASPVPGGVTGKINGFDLEFSKDRRQARAVTGWDNNANDNIGVGDFTLTLSGLASGTAVKCIQVEFYDDGVNPYTNYDFRHYGKDSIDTDYAFPGEENYGGQITPIPKP